MAKLNMRQIQGRALHILERAKGTTHWSEMLREIHCADPETPWNTIQGALQRLLARDEQIIKVGRGTYRLDKRRPS